MLACYAPCLPDPAGIGPPLWAALIVRADERAREWLGPVGVTVRWLADLGVVTLAGGVLRDPVSGLALDRAHAVERWEAHHQRAGPLRWPPSPTTHGEDPT